MQPSQQYVSIKEAAKQSNFSPAWIVELCRRGSIGYKEIKTFPRRQFREVDIVSLLAFRDKDLKRQTVHKWLAADETRLELSAKAITDAMCSAGVKVSYSTVCRVRNSMRVPRTVLFNKALEWFKANPQSVYYTLDKIEIELNLLGHDIPVTIIKKARLKWLNEYHKK